MALRSFYVSWGYALAEGEKLLDRLTRLTDLTALELVNFDVDWGVQGHQPAPLMLPADGALGRLGLRFVAQERLDAAMRFMESARAVGLHVVGNFAPLYANSKALAAGTCIDATGAPVRGLLGMPTYGCPNDPGVLDYGLSMMREAVRAWPSADMLAINHVEFPLWADASLHEVFACFCASCRARAGEEGLDLREVRRDALALYEGLMSGAPASVGPERVLGYVIRHPGIAAWLDFRLRSMTGYVSALIGAARRASREHHRGLRLGMEFLPPTLALAAGTDFVTLGRGLDFIAPKFPDYLTGAVIPRALGYTRAGPQDRARLTSAIRALFGLGEEQRGRTPRLPREGLTRGGTFDPTMIDLQMKCLAPLKGRLEVYPYTWLHDKDVRALRARLERFRAHGLDGYMVSGWDWDLDERFLRRAGRAF